MVETIYLASSFDLGWRVEEVYARLLDEGLWVPDVWWRAEPLRESREASEEDVRRMKIRHERAIENSDALVLVCPDPPAVKKFNGGTYELGYAASEGLDLHAYGHLEESAMFYGVHEHETLDDLVAALQDLSSLLGGDDD